MTELPITPKDPRTAITDPCRRTFLRNLSAATAFTILPGGLRAQAGKPGPNGKTTVACIGLGGQGMINLGNLLGIDEVQVVAVCDVDRESEGFLSWNWGKGQDRRLAGREPGRRLVNETYAGKRGKNTYDGCRTYADYRDLLDREDVDAVIVSVPDHNHAVITMAALKRGKHVYCEKPLTWSVEEARLIAEAARQAGVATQLGNQSQAGEEARITREYIMAGAIGAVREVHINHNKLFWDPPTALPTDRPPVPEGLDWNLWLGPAPVRPYHPAYHPWRWRDWLDFGTGPLGDMGCHILSTPFKALNLSYPETIVGETADPFGPEIYARRIRVRFEFPARGEMPPVAVIWHDQDFEPPIFPEAGSNKRLRGPIYVGDDGIMDNYRILPAEKMKAFGRPPKVLPRSPGQYQEWIDACRGGPPAGSDFVKHSGILTETILLGNIALRTGQRLRWDGPNLRFTNSEEANQFLGRSYRTGWSLS